MRFALRYRNAKAVTPSSPSSGSRRPKSVQIQRLSFVVSLNVRSPSLNSGASGQVIGLSYAQNVIWGLDYLGGSSERPSVRRSILDRQLEYGHFSNMDDLARDIVLKLQAGTTQLLLI